MYLIPITVPVYMDGETPVVSTEWKRSLELLRDSLEGRYGPLVSAGPTAPAVASEQALEHVTPEDGIKLVPLFDQTTSARAYWQGGMHKETAAKLAPFMGRDDVVHGTVSDPLRPFSNTALIRASRAGLPTVFVLDQDDATSMQDLVADKGIATRLKTRLIAKLYERQARRATRAAGLCLFKGGAVPKYSALAADVLPIEDTSYLSHEVVAEPKIRARLADLQKGDRRMQFVFAGRLIPLKGLDRSLRLIAGARDQGANVGLTIIGSGPEEDALKAQAAALGIADHVTFPGGMPYGPALLEKLGTCDALLFNPRISETPRMLFDAYAAGVPIVADAIPYVKERQQAEAATLSFPWNDDAAGIAAIVDLDRNRGKLTDLTENALQARAFHAADTWYKRRADATHAMVDRVRGSR